MILALGISFASTCFLTWFTRYYAIKIEVINSNNSDKNIVVSPNSVIKFYTMDLFSRIKTWEVKAAHLIPIHEDYVCWAIKPVYKNQYKSQKSIFWTNINRSSLQIGTAHPVIQKIDQFITKWNNLK